MQRLVMLAFVFSAAGVVAASAQPMSLNASNYAYGPPAAAVSQPVPQDVRYSQPPQSNLGGGFIEFLFGGNPGRPPMAPHYQPAPNMQPVGQPPVMQPVSPPPSMQVNSDPAIMTPARPAADPKYLRQVVAYRGQEKPGTVIIDTPDKFLYLIEPGGKAIRYGIGVGRPGFTWSGVKAVSAKREWPDWRPPEEMLKRRPDLPHFMAGGPDNPLGARAMYLGSTLYRIHGSNEPWTIGTQVSSGCIRMRNEDVIDLYDRIKVGTRVVVI
ncbi:MAG: L,D-transpeptidase family protein [Rhizobiales bacterium]|nr:L,D-transpeptidase family protein [Hyphomicrobiales bacterium]